MEIWYAFPSCSRERASRAIGLWKARGYKVAICTDDGGPDMSGLPADLPFHSRAFPGWCPLAGKACKILVELYQADIVVWGADDIDPPAPVPDPGNPEPPAFEAGIIGAQFAQRFPDLYGVMQPTGDALEGTDRICGSPWLGKAWILESYQGEGPFWKGYFQYYGDEELKEVSEAQGVLWQRPGLVQFHHHWLRMDGGWPKTDYQFRNDDAYMGPDGDEFRRRKATGFPCSERKT